MLPNKGMCHSDDGAVRIIGRSRWYASFVLLTCASLVLFFGGASGCRFGGSSDPSSEEGEPFGEEPGVIEGLEIASHLSLVEAEEGTGLSSLLLKSALTGDTSTPFYTDPREVHVYDRSMEPLRTINEILCMIDQTHYAEMVNRGPYIALVDTSFCSNDKSSEVGSPSVGASTKDFETWVVSSVRAGSDTEHVVSVWIENQGGDYDDPKRIEARLTIAEAKSDEHPFGVFHLDFVMKEPWWGTTVGRGYLESIARSSGEAEFQFSMEEMDRSTERRGAAHAVINAGGNSGYATVSHNFEDHDGKSGTFQIAYNENHYRALEIPSGVERCLSRKHFENFVYRYGLYDSNGWNVEPENPGFGIRYGDDMCGFAGYYGIWLPEEFDLTSGLTVRRSNKGGSIATYTTVVVPGKLIRHTKEAVTLGEIRNVSLNYWDNDIVYRVVWDGTNLVKKATQSCTPDSPCTWTEIPEAPLSLEVGMWVNFWRESSGNLFFQMPEGGLSDQTTITFDRNEIVTSGANEFLGGPVTLYCAHQCLKPELTEAQINWEGDSPYLDDVEEPSSVYLYTIDPADMTLRYGGNAVKVEEGVTTAEGPHQWGIQSGPMVLSPDGIENPWDFWNEPVNYTWETGTNDWNKFSGLIDADGQAVVFDPPLRLDYKHTDGIRYTLEYNGRGELHGIPWLPEEGTDHWYPTVTVADGTAVTSEDGTTYYIRSLEMEQRMREVNAGNCTGLEGEALGSPDDDYTNPAIGPKPVVEADPAVIGGELMIP